MLLAAASLCGDGHRCSSPAAANSPDDRGGWAGRRPDRCARWATCGRPSAVHDDDLPRGCARLRSPADRCAAAPASVRWESGRLECGQRLLPGCAAGGICVQLPPDARAGASSPAVPPRAGTRAADPLPADRDSRDGRYVRAATRHRRHRGPRPVCRRAVRRRLDHRAAHSALVQLHRPSRGGRSLLPLCREQHRKLAHPPHVSLRDRAAPDLGAAVDGMVDRVRPLRDTRHDVRRRGLALDRSRIGSSEMRRATMRSARPASMPTRSPGVRAQGGSSWPPSRQPSPSESPSTSAPISPRFRSCGSRLSPSIC